MLNRLLKILWVVAAAAALTSCSKKQPVASSAQPDPASTATSPAPETPPTDAAQAPAAGPVLDTSQLTGDPKQAMAEADAALRQRNYEKAVQTLLAIQQAQLNAQQAEAARQQMIALQRNLMSAVDAGDPNAIAAAKALRAAHRH